MCCIRLHRLNAQRTTKATFLSFVLSARLNRLRFVLHQRTIHDCSVCLRNRSIITREKHRLFRFFATNLRFSKHGKSIIYSGRQTHRHPRTYTNQIQLRDVYGGTCLKTDLRTPFSSAWAKERRWRNGVFLKGRNDFAYRFSGYLRVCP